jgi:flagellar hook assembly protein FlgD
VELNIFNVQGILVKKLIAEPLQQGNYSIAWNGDDNSGTVVASGIYFYSLNSGGKTFTGKMTLLK